MKKLLKNKITKIWAIIFLIILLFNSVQPVFAISGSGSGQFVGGQFDSGIRTTENVGTEYGMLIRRLVNYTTGESITVFCAENFVNFNTGTIVNASYYPPSNINLKQACKIAYFGWYSKHGDYVVNGGTISDYDTKMDYVFTQQYIWEALGQSSATFLDGNIQSMYENFKTNINNEINYIQAKPSFSGQTIELLKGETKTITDTNYVLRHYKNLDKTINGIRIVHNEGNDSLSITANNDCSLDEYTIYADTFQEWGFIKGGTENNDTTIYFEFSNGVQNQLYAMNYNDPVSLALKIKINSYGKLELTKTNENGDFIDGAIFKVTGPDNYYNEVTVTNGKITLENLKEGTYYVTEIKAPNGYLLNDTTYEVSVNPNETSHQNISNKKPTGKFSLVKKNTSGETIKGTKYRIWNDSGYDKQFTTDANGKIEVTGLELGKYYYQEIQASSGYLLDSTTYSFELKYKDQHTSVINASAEKTNDKPTGKFTLVKKNVDGETIKGTKYRIWNDSGYDRQFTTDANGKIEVTGLELGKYYYQEIQASSGYLLDSTIYSFELKYKDQNTSVVYANAEKTNDKPTGKFTLVKKNVDGETIKGTKYRIWNDSGYDRQFTTDANGKIEVTGLELGKYYYQEVQASNGYLLDSTTYSFELKYKDQNTSVVYANAEKTNERPTGDFTLTKMNKGGTTKISGTIYHFWSDNGYDKQFTTNSNGEIKITGLELGKYYYQEVQASNGYLLDEKIYSFELTYKDQHTRVISASAIRYNDVPSGSFTLTKKNISGETIQGTKYRIWNNKGYDKQFTTDANGKIEVTGLELGKYYYQEIQASNGYIIDEKIYSFELRYKDQYTSVIYDNAERENEKTMGQFTLIKKNVAGTQNLSNAKYRVWGDNGYDKQFTTDANGKIEVKNLELGKYYYQEIQAPYGYVIDEKIYSFELKYKDQYTKVVYANAERTNEKTMGEFTLIKKNADSSANIPETKYRIWNDSGYDKQFTTDANGKIEVKDLELGKYYYQEIQASNGYLLDEKIYSFELTYKDQYTKIVYANATKTNIEPTGKITIIKKDSKTGSTAQGNATLENAIYKVYANEDIYNKARTKMFYSNGDLVATRTMNKDGITEDITELPLGKYIIKEEKASLGYLLDTQEYKIDLKYKDQNTKVISNITTSLEKVKEMGIHIFKSGIKENSGETPGLENAEFSIKLYSDVERAYEKGYTYAEIWNGIDENGNKVNVNNNRVSEAQVIAPTYEVIKTDKDGNAYTKNLPYGKFIVKETKTPADYETAIDFTFSITEDESEITEISKKTKHIVVNNEQLEAYIKIVKKDIKTDKLVTLNSTTFEIKATKDIYDRATKQILFKKGEVISQKIGNTTYNSFTTNADNIVVPTKSFNSENDDKATITTPLKLPVGSYEITELKVPDGFLQLEESIKFDIKNLRDYDKDQDGDFIKEIIVKNEQPTGTIKLNKIIAIREDIDTSIIDISDLSGIEFKLLAKEDIIDYADGSVIYKKGEEIKRYNLTKDGNLIISNLPLGIYEIEETKTLQGLVLNRTKYEIKFEQTDLITKVYNENIEVSNDTTLVELSKTDITGENELPGAKLSVLDNKGNVVDTWTSTNKTHKIEGLVIGKEYILKEEIAPDGYVVATEIKFIIKDTKETQKVVMKDKLVEMSKVDIAGEEIEGAKIQVLDKNGNIIDEWISTKEPHKIKNLIEEEKYILHEEIAPDGYVISTDIEFKVTSEKENQKVVMKDKIVEMSKVDIAGEEIEGAKIQVLDKDGNIIDEWISTKEPHKIKNLIEEEKYILHEEIAPDGYVISADIEFEVTSEKENQKVVMKDKLVEMSKVDIAGEEIEGAKLKVLDKDGNVVDSWTSTKELHKIKGLKENETYTLYEDYAPDGFVISNKIEFKVTTDKEIQKVVMIDKVFEIVKTDLTNNEELEGAKLEVIDEDRNIIDSWISTKEAHKVKGLEEGKTYILKEISAPYGYEITEEIKFIVTEDKEIQKIDMKDMPILKNIRIIKVDSETNEIIKDKFTFAIYEDLECTKLIEEIKSNSGDGIVLFEKLRYGTYYIKETKAPTDYELSDKVVKVEINDKGIFVDEKQFEENDNVIEFTFENKKIEVPKTGHESKIYLFVGIIVLSLLGIAYIFIRNRSKKD